MDEASVAEDDPALLTLELILLDLTWIRLPKVDQDQFIIPTLCFKVLDFPLVTFSPDKEEHTDSKADIVTYNQGKSCIFRTGLRLLSEQFRTYPIYSFLMDTCCQPAPMVAFGSFPLQAVRDDIARFTEDGSAWPTVSAQHGQAYLRNTRGRRVALINFALRLSCLSDSGATGEPVAPAAQRPVHRPIPPPAVNRGGLETPAAAAGTRWPHWNHPVTENPVTGGGQAAAGALAEPSESFESAREVRTVGRSDQRQPRPAAVPESAGTGQELRVVRLTDRPPAATGLPTDRHVAWRIATEEEDQQRPRNGRPYPTAHLPGGPLPPFGPLQLDDVSVDDCPPSVPPPPMGRPRGAAPATARSRSSSADCPAEPAGGSCWRAPLETDEGSLASDASSGPIVSRLIQELAAMQRATAQSKHVAVQTKPLREFQARGPLPPPRVAPVRGTGRRRPRLPRVRRLPLISEEPVTEGFARRRPAGTGTLRRPPLPAPDTTVVDRLSRGQPVAERRTTGGRLRGPPARLRPVTLTRTAQLRLARHMADVRHDLNAQEYGRRRDRWLAEQRRRTDRNRPRPPLPLPEEELPQPQLTSPPAVRSAPAGRRRGRQVPPQPSQPVHAAAVKSIGVQFESDSSPPAAEDRARAAGKAESQVSPPSSFVEPRLAASPSSRSAEPRIAAGDRASSYRLGTVKLPSDALNSTGGSSNLSGGPAGETASPSRDLSSPREVRRSQSATAARSSPRSPSQGAARSRSETAPRSAANRQAPPAAVSPPDSSAPLEPDSPPVKSSVSEVRRRRSPGSAAQLTSGDDAVANRGNASESSGRRGAGRGKSPGGQDVIAGAAGSRSGSSGQSVTSSTLRTDRRVSEELISAARRSPPSSARRSPPSSARPSPPSAAGSVRTESAVSAAGSGRRSSKQTVSSSSASTPAQSVPTESAAASQAEERTTASTGGSTSSSSSSSSSSEEESSESASSESSSSLTEASRTQTRTQTQSSATQTSSGAGRAPASARRGGKSPDSGNKQKPGTGARPKPAPRRPPTWHRVDEPPDSVPTQPTTRVFSGAVTTLSSGPVVVSSTPAQPAPAAVAARRSRSSSRDSAEIDARIAMFLKQSGERQRQQEREQQQQQQQENDGGQEQEEAPVGASWLKGSSAGLGGGGSSWLKVWRVDEDGGPPAGTGGRRASRGRHTLSQQPAGLNTDSVSSYAPSDLDGTLSGMTPP